MIIFLESKREREIKKKIVIESWAGNKEKKSTFCALPKEISSFSVRISRLTR